MQVRMRAAAGDTGYADSYREMMKAGADALDTALAALSRSVDVDDAIAMSFAYIREKYPDANWVEEPSEQDREIGRMVYLHGYNAGYDAKAAEELSAFVEQVEARADECERQGKSVHEDRYRIAADVMRAVLKERTGENKMIKPEPVEFDKYGMWSHSAITGLDEKYDEVPYHEIPALASLELKGVRIFDDDKIELLQGPKGDNPPDFRKWQPEPPDGEEWFPFSYSEDEDGPYVLYARQRTEGRHEVRDRPGPRQRRRLLLAAQGDRVPEDQGARSMSTYYDRLCEDDEQEESAAQRVGRRVEDLPEQDPVLRDLQDQEGDRHRPPPETPIYRLPY